MKSKKILVVFVFLIVLSILFSVKVFASYGYIDRETRLHYKVVGDEITITGVEEGITKVDIPETIEGKTVTTIGQQAFYGRNDIVSITIPNTVEFIEFWAFRGCENITEIKLPSNLKTLNGQTFSGCTNLQNIELPQNLESLNAECFVGTSITKIKLPKNLSNIGNAALSISTLQEIDTSENNYFEFKNGVLYSKDLKTLVVALSNVTSINMESTVETIQGFAFSNCNKLSNINITEKVKSIGPVAFSNSNLKGITVDPKNNYFTVVNNNLYSFDGTILYRLFDTGNVIIKDGVKNIIRGALSNNGTIKSITLPDSFVGDTTINEWVVFPSIEYLYLPQNVNSFKKSAYYNVKNIEVSKENPYFQSINNEYILSKDGTELYWVKSDLTEVNIPESVETIKEYALMYSKAEVVELPEKVKKLENNILYFASTKKLIIQSKISEISTGAFAMANNLSEVVIHKKNDGTLTGSPWGCVYGDKAIIWDD